MTPKLPKVCTLVPFISHRLVLPSLLRHRMSLLPSLLLSASRLPSLVLRSLNCRRSMPVRVSVPSSPSPLLVSVTV